MPSIVHVHRSFPVHLIKTILHCMSTVIDKHLYALVSDFTVKMAKTNQGRGYFQNHNLIITICWLFTNYSSIFCLTLRHNFFQIC